MDVTAIRYRGRGMGKVVAKVKITNLMDRIEADMGERSEETVRSRAIDNAIVDTGANSLCLPAPMVRELGLQRAREIQIKTAGGMRKTWLCRCVSLEIGDRSRSFDCVELPEGTSVLIGVIPLEALGLEPDLQNQRLRVLPMNDDESYETAYGSLP